MKKNIILLTLLLLLGVLPMLYGVMTTFSGGSVATIEPERTAPAPAPAPPSEGTYPDEDYSFPERDVRDLVLRRAVEEKNEISLESVIGAIGTNNSIIMGWAMFYFNVVRRKKEA